MGKDKPLAVGSDAALFGAMNLEQPDLSEVREAVAKQDWKAAKAA